MALVNPYDWWLPHEIKGRQNPYVSLVPSSWRFTFFLGARWAWAAAQERAHLQGAAFTTYPGTCGRPRHNKAVKDGGQEHSSW